MYNLLQTVRTAATTTQWRHLANQAEITLRLRQTSDQHRADFTKTKSWISSGLSVHRIVVTLTSKYWNCSTSCEEVHKGQSTGCAFAPVSGGDGYEVRRLLELGLELCPPDCVDVESLRKSTWMRPIIGDRELAGGKLLGDGSRVFQSSRTAQCMLRDFYLFMKMCVAWKIYFCSQHKGSISIYFRFWISLYHSTHLYEPYKTVTSVVLISEH